MTQLSSMVSHWATVEEWREHLADEKRSRRNEYAFSVAITRWKTKVGYDEPPHLLWQWVELLRGIGGFGVVCLLGFYARLVSVRGV